MTTILTAVAVFILTIVGLVVVLMVARNKLVPSGSVKVPARLSPALSTHAPAGAPPKSVGFEFVGRSASRWK